MTARLILALAAPLAMAAQDAPPPQTGVLCQFVITAWVEQVAMRCTPKASPEILAALHDSVSRIGRFARANSKFSEADLARLIDDQAGTKLPDAELCGESAADVRRGLGEATPDKIRADTDAFVARPREVKLDPCT